MAAGEYVGPLTGRHEQADLNSNARSSGRRQGEHNELQAIYVERGLELCWRNRLPNIDAHDALGARPRRTRHLRDASCATDQLHWRRLAALPSSSLPLCHCHGSGAILYFCGRDVTAVPRASRRPGRSRGGARVTMGAFASPSGVACDGDHRSAGWLSEQLRVRHREQAQFWAVLTGAIKTRLPTIKSGPRLARQKR